MKSTPRHALSNPMKISTHNEGLSNAEKAGKAGNTPVSSKV